MRTALIVGIDDYPERPLCFCKADAAAMADLLKGKEYAFTVTTLTDSQATRKNVRAALEAAFSAKPELLLFYFAGHGTATDLGGCLDTVDADDSDEGISLDLLRRLAEVRTPPGSALVYVLDCCHAGLAVARRKSRGAVPLRGEDIRRELGGLGGTGRVVLGACLAHELAYESPEHQHGAFTYLLLEGLLGYAADSHGEVTAMSLYEYVSRKFQSKRSQTPVFSGDLAGHIILGSGFTPVPRQPPGLEVLLAAERQAEKHLRSFHDDLAQLRKEPGYWRTQGFRQACTKLEAILRWFDHKSEELAGLVERQPYKSLLSDLTLRRGELCQLTPGTFTTEGEAREALGHGNFGTVWRIRGQSDGAPELAYKVFHPQDLTNEEKVSRFERGFYAMERLDHPRIVRVHRLTLCPFGYFMDYIPGSNLRKFVGTFDHPADTMGLLITIAETLQHAHGRDVIHRDLKPENVLLNYETEKGWRAYLTDFDLAWFSTATQITKSALGATYYASPEQIDKPGSASARAKTTDMYSFGQLLYFAVCGNDPPREGSIHGLKARVHEGWSQEPAHRLVALFERCTQHVPSKRPYDFRDIAEELVAIRSLLLGRQDHTRILAATFLREVAFSLAGLEGELDIDQNAFCSLSGRIRVSAEVFAESGESKVVFSVHCVEAPFIPGTNHQRMREILLARVDKALQQHAGVSKRAGNQLPFQVYVEVRQPLTFAGAISAASVLGRVIDAIEGAT